VNRNGKIKVEGGNGSLWSPPTPSLLISLKREDKAAAVAAAAASDLINDRNSGLLWPKRTSRLYKETEFHLDEVKGYISLDQIYFLNIFSFNIISFKNNLSETFYQ